MKRGLAFLTLSMAGDAVYIRRKHEAGRVRNAYPAGPPVEFSRPQMHLFTVAPITVGGGMGDRGNRPDLMAKRTVAIRAFNLMARDMILMDELGGILRAENHGLVMTLETFSLRYMTVPLDHTQMASLTGHSSCDVLPVIEIPSLDLDIPFGLDVAGHAASDSTRNAVLLSFRARFIVVTDEAVDFMDGEMQPLNQLSVTAGATELHPPSELAQMFSVRERDILVDHVPLEVSDLVTSLLETTRIADLRVRRARPLPRQEVSQ